MFVVQFLAFCFGNMIRAAMRAPGAAGHGASGGAQKGAEGSMTVGHHV